MPVLIVAALVSLVIGLTVRQATTAYALSGALGLVGIIAFVRAVTDGQGDDPAWIVLLAVAGLAVDLALCALAHRMRHSTVHA